MATTRRRAMRTHTTRSLRESSFPPLLGRQPSATSSPSPKTPTMCQYSKHGMRVKRGSSKAMATAIFSLTCDQKLCLSILLPLQPRLEERGLVITVILRSMCRGLWMSKAWQMRRVACRLIRSRIMGTTAAYTASGMLSERLLARWDPGLRNPHVQQ